MIILDCMQRIEKYDKTIADLVAQACEMWWQQQRPNRHLLVLRPLIYLMTLCSKKEAKVSFSKKFFFFNFHCFSSF